MILSRPRRGRQPGAAVRAELRGLGAVLLLVFEDGALCVGPDDELWRIGSGDARDAADRAAMRARYGVPPGATGLFIIDGDRRLRFSYIEVAPRQGTLHTIAAALSATGPIDMSRLILSRRELVVSSLAAAFALALTEPPARAAPRRRLRRRRPARSRSSFSSTARRGGCGWIRA